VHGLVETRDQAEDLLDGARLAGRGLRQQLLRHAPHGAFEHVRLAHKVPELVEEPFAELFAFLGRFSHVVSVAARRTGKPSAVSLGGQASRSETLTAGR